MYTAPPRWALSPSRSAAPDLWRGCAFAVCYAWGTSDVVGGLPGQPTTGGVVPVPVPAVGERGGSYLCQVGDTDQSWMGSAIGYGRPSFSNWQGEFSLAVFVRFDGKQTNNALIGRRVVLDPTYPGLTLTRTPTGRLEVEGNVISSDGVLGAGDTALVVFTRRGSDARLFCRGVQIASNSNYVGVASPEEAGGTFWVGGGFSDTNGAPTISHNGLVYVAMAWERALDPAEVQSLTLDPFAMFRPVRRVMAPLRTIVSVEGSKQVQVTDEISLVQQYSAFVEGSQQPQKTDDVSLRSRTLLLSLKSVQRQTSDTISLLAGEIAANAGYIIVVKRDNNVMLVSRESRVMVILTH